MAHQEFQQVIRENSRPLNVQSTGMTPRYGRLEDIQAVLFDVYGTLFISGSGDIGVHSSENRSDQFNHAFEAIGLEPEGEPEKILASLTESILASHETSKKNGIDFPEIDIVEIWSIVLKHRSLTDDQLARLAVEYESRVNPVWPMPGLEDCLARIASKYRMGLISNAQFFTLELFPAFLKGDRAATGFDPSLEFFSYQTGHAKPGMELYRQAKSALESYSILPNQVLYIGNDMRNDIGPAHRIGFQTALFAGDRRSLRMRSEDLDLDGVNPGIIVTDLGQIAESLGV